MKRHRFTRSKNSVLVCRTSSVPVKQTIFILNLFNKHMIHRPYTREVTQTRISWSNR